MAYLFSFTKFAGIDRVFYARNVLWNPGDLLEVAGDIVLHLGESVAFPEMYLHSYAEVPMRVIYPWFFDQHFLSFLHWMVYGWYSTYKNVMKYFVSMEVEKLLGREGRWKLKAESSKLGQVLVIFPDVWTSYTMGWEKGVCLQLLSTDTQNRKDINWWAIKKGLVQTVIATQSEVFQPFRALEKIIFVDPQKWYYHNQQDPRYSLPTVVQKMAEIYGAEVVEIKNTGTLAF